MITYCRPFAILLAYSLLLTPVLVRANESAPSTEANSTAAAASNYVSQVVDLLTDAHTSDVSQAVTDHLLKCVEDAREIAQLSDDQNARRIDRLNLYSNVVKRRISRMDNIIQPLHLTTNALVRAEYQAYIDNLHPILDEQALKRTRYQIELFNRKYFDEDDPKQSNLAEARLNDVISALAFDENSRAPYRKEGVSAWEFTLRAEPFVLFDGKESKGALLAAGLLWNFFPDANDKGVAEDNKLSKHVKRAGLRVGAGAVDAEGTEFSVGAGLQVRAISAWAIHQPDGDQWDFALGVSDWEWFKKWLPLFGK